MTTETDLRTALRARADDAPTVDADQLLATVALDAPVARSTAGSSHGRRWAIAGVAAGFVALAAVAGVLVASGAGPDTSAPAAPLPSPTLADTAPPPGTPQPPTSPPSTNPYDPAAPVPVDASWHDTVDDQSVDIDDSAIVFSDDPIVAFYIRPHQQLSILPAAGTRKDSSDALWDAAVQVYLPGSGFDPSSVGDPASVTVNGITRQFGTLPRILDVPGPAQVPSLVWPVGDAWVVLQIDNPAVASETQLATAAARLDVHHG